ncbi:HEPN domain-containing protein [Dolichospermum sp. ST_con]|nr:HEPN domain-containing protein [Dolichospermum sp. ST_con]MDD1417617.1 HEPN domain-containing protein [Dolichospermum sp. ST_sed1]MDD1427612.1 HEPN domain-containing protein [Dolichospermum sp. ST_sed9]MDD1430708.1 HEPN domain-containing protein [Dolichospermum sp. ST_sed6]MDD1435200.1 HEPN domain-containing protein [Dolichospermum sp. ST_sed10]MDD1440254.1 HEPN domain-containing protein [Dolichospermum sp. ST_sed3]MDD1447033.1 HEPN domain-containing protein [Dolichospermum sp. ST_sed8]MD
MTDEQQELLLKAQQSLEAAKLLLTNHFPDYATSRAYYSMFDIAEAFLEGNGLSFSKHSAVIAAFGREFAKTQQVPRDFHRFLIEAQELRTTGDYGQLNAITTDQATEQIDRAEQFLFLAIQMMGAI